jgi:serine/threonine protein kinase
LLAAIRHDRIVSFQGICLDASGWPKYVLTELALGNMRQYLQRLGTPISADDLREFAIDIFSGLAYLHELTPNSIIHRDLKPENILAFEIRPTLAVMKIGDVGLARFYHSSESVVLSAAGSAFYMSPEVALLKQYDGRADVFSAGVTLCEVVVSFMLVPPWAMADVHRDRDGMQQAAVGHLYKLGTPASLQVARTLKACTMHDAQARPTSRQVLNMLTSQDASSVDG